LWNNGVHTKKIANEVWKADRIQEDTKYIIHMYDSFADNENSSNGNR
jgi:hypothetical protein